MGKQNFVYRNWQQAGLGIAGLALDLWISRNFEVTNTVFYFSFSPVLSNTCLTKAYRKDPFHFLFSRTDDYYDYYETSI